MTWASDFAAFAMGLLGVLTTFQPDLVQAGHSALFYFYFFLTLIWLGARLGAEVKARRQLAVQQAVKDLIWRARMSIKTMNSQQEWGEEHFRTEAMEWFHEVMAFLEMEYSDKRVAMFFKYHEKEAGMGPFQTCLGELFRQEYPMIYKGALFPIVAFYRLRIEFLEQLGQTYSTA